MSKNTTLQRNLLALSGKNPNTARKIAQAESSSALSIRTAKSGRPVPVLQSDGYQRALHSTFDPVRDGERTSQNHSNTGYFVVFGLGAGYHVLPLLDDDDISYILIIEHNVSMVRSLFEQLDFHSFFIHPKVNLLVDEPPSKIKEFILGNYFPAITGNLQTLHLRSRYELDRAYFNSVLEAIDLTIGALSDDYTVQAYFGKKWFLNTVSNLEAAEKSSTVLPPAKKAVITGAGPSLERQIPEVVALQREGCLLIATDTTLPALLKYKIKPDLVISIDCQHITYHHFISGYPKDVPLVLDLASPTGTTRLTDKLVFFTSGHPFSLYVNSHWRRFPRIDISGGNVSHAAISLALKLGAKKIYLAGTDFSYPDGKSYSRGTYLYSYFSQFAKLTSPLESQFFSFLLRNRNIEKELIDGRYRYTTKPMISYKERLVTAFTNSPAQFIPLDGLGVPIEIPVSKDAGKDPFPYIFSAGTSSHNWQDFLKQYVSGLEELSIPQSMPISVYFSNLEPYQRDLWVTLLPAAAVFQKRTLGDADGGHKVLQKVRGWSIGIIKQFLQNHA